MTDTIPPIGEAVAFTAQGEPVYLTKQYRSLLELILRKVTKAEIADAVTAHNLNATFSNTEAEAALNALGTKINEVIGALKQ